MAKGEIKRVEKVGYGVITSDDKEYIFTLDKMKDYHGESIGELGLKKGVKVKFQLVEEDVSDIEIST